MEDRELILRLKDGDGAAFKDLYQKYWPKVHNFSCLFLTSSSEIEEVVQEVFVKLWETRCLLRADDKFEGFLFIITRNLIFNQFRRSFNETNYKLAVLHSVNESYNIEEEMDTADLKAYITHLIEELPPRQKEVFIMSREKHLSYKEIAMELSISEKTVERHINEALKFLRKNIYLLSLFIA